MPHKAGREDGMAPSSRRRKANLWGAGRKHNLKLRPIAGPFDFRSPSPWSLHARIASERCPATGRGTVNPLIVTPHFLWNRS